MSQRACMRAARLLGLGERFFLLARVMWLAFLASAILLVSGGLSWTAAMPPHPDLKGKVRVWAIEIYRQAKKLSSRLDAPGPLIKAQGTFRALVILVDFSDNQGQTDKDHFYEMLFSLGTYPTGSMRDYYQEVSYGQFDLTGEVNGTIGAPPDWFRMPQTYSYYLGGQSGLGNYPTNAQKLAEDAVVAADPYVDYRRYDNNGDGEVDSLFIIHAGPSAEASTNPEGSIWSHRWEMKNPPVLDGMRFRGYSMESEYTRTPGDGTIGVFCHEYGHELGLPDLYDVGHSGGEGIGNWGVMGGGSWNGTPHGSRPAHFCAWSKVKLGWVNPIVLRSNQIKVNIPQVETQPSIFLLWTDGAVGTQYFLVENRQKVLFDDSLPGDGLLIYHVDDQVKRQDNPVHYKVDVEQADGAFDLNNGTNSGDQGDPWPGSVGKRNFNQSSTPNSADYQGQKTQVAVRNISSSAPVMSADLYVSGGD
ncbi:MAG: M6 family metalloprotease domain-containing protein [bacterium]|nr:M6 family metalloprotease domain-containing protein [bacterium]